MANEDRTDDVNTVVCKRGTRTNRKEVVGDGKALPNLRTGLAQGSALGDRFASEIKQAVHIQKVCRQCQVAKLLIINVDE